MKVVILLFTLTSLLTNAFAVEGIERDRAAIKALVASVQLLAKSDLSCTSGSDCVALAVGSRACGGPSSFVVTSKDNANLAELETLTHATTEKEYAFNHKYRIVSICSVAMPPELACEKKLCK